MRHDLCIKYVLSVITVVIIELSEKNMVLIAALRAGSRAKGLVATVPLDVPSKAEVGGRSLRAWGRDKAGGGRAAAIRRSAPLRAPPHVLCPADVSRGCLSSECAGASSDPPSLTRASLGLWFSFFLFP